MRFKFYRAFVFILRLLRWIEWWVVSAWTIDHLTRLETLNKVLSIDGSGVGVGTSAYLTTEFVGLFIVAFSTDRILELAIDDLRDRLPRPT